jgi:alkylated DNA repair protein (DNA oxidative demethylase)
MTDLFNEEFDQKIQIADGAYCLRGFVLPVANDICAMLTQHFKAFPPQQMMTPMGYPMSVKTTSFGKFGWVGTPQGYGYSEVDLVTKKAWPPMPAVFFQLATDAAKEGGYSDFVPDTCLVNLYAIGTKMGLHRDQDELDFSQPIVSVSLGISATFLFGGAKRSDKTTKIPLTHGDVVVWGGKSRLHYHAIMPLKPNTHELLGACRINLTFRKAR